MKEPADPSTDISSREKIEISQRGGHRFKQFFPWLVSGVVVCLWVVFASFFAYYGTCRPYTHADPLCVGYCNPTGLPRLQDLSTDSHSSTQPCADPNPKSVPAALAGPHRPEVAYLQAFWHGTVAWHPPNPRRRL